MIPLAVSLPTLRNSTLSRFVAVMLCIVSMVIHLSADEYLVISGGPALNKHERDKQIRHDRYWGNFIQTAETRLREMQAKAKPGDIVTWMIYRTGYERRNPEEEINIIADIEQRAAGLGIPIRWFRRTDEVIFYINRGQDRSRHPIVQLDMFGHSNKACFMFDYSNNIDGCSTVFLHTRDLPLISPRAFRRDSLNTSWGCHPGEYWVDRWRQATKTSMWGAVGKTDYSYGAMMPIISTPGGRWVNQVPPEARR